MMSLASKIRRTDVTQGGAGNGYGGRGVRTNGGRMCHLF